MNTNIITALRNLPTQVVANTTATVAVANTGPFINGVATGSRLLLSIPLAANVDGIPFRVRISGTMVWFSSGSGATMTLNSVVGSTVRSIATITNNSPFTPATNWSIECVCLWDSTSLVLNGCCSYVFLDAARTAPTANINQVLTTGPADLTFAADIKFFDSLPNNSIQVEEFVISYF